MSRIHRILAAALACATLTAAPGLAMAASPSRPLVVHRAVAARIDPARSYASWVEGRLQASLTRIDQAMLRVRLTPEQRQQIGYDVSFSASTLRARLAKVVSDRDVTDVEKQEMRLLAAAIQHDLERLHGNLDSWWLI